MDNGCFFFERFSQLSTHTPYVPPLCQFGVPYLLCMTNLDERIWRKAIWFTGIFSLFLSQLFLAFTYPPFCISATSNRRLEILFYQYNKAIFLLIHPIVKLDVAPHREFLLPFLSRPYIFC